MSFIVYTTSNAFKNYFKGLAEQSVEFRKELTAADTKSDNLLFFHITSYGKTGFDWLNNFAVEKNLKIVMCSNQPNIEEMLEAVSFGVKAYCNCYMQTQHYLQLIRLVENGQSWYPPELLTRTFELAHKAIHGIDVEKLMADLTAREKDISRAVAKGLSNKKIADEFNISELTVKTHLTNIFKKLQLKDRVALILYLKQVKTNH